MQKFAFLLVSLLVGLMPTAWAGSDSVDLKSWSVRIDNAAKRFVVLDAFDDAAVLDKETQLVWERSPSGRLIWPIAIQSCYGKNVGGRMGWRLPTVEELTSLVDPSTSDHLPAGHPFNNVIVGDPYWSATTYGAPGFTGNAWTVQFDIGQAGYLGKTLDLRVWCVRGGHGYDGGLNP